MSLFFYGPDFKLRMAMAVNSFPMTSSSEGSQKPQFMVWIWCKPEYHINKHVNKWPSVDWIVSDMQSLELCECAKTFGNTSRFLNKAGLVFQSEHVYPSLQGSSGVFDANRCTSVPTSVSPFLQRTLHPEHHSLWVNIILSFSRQKHSCAALNEWVR